MYEGKKHHHPYLVCDFTSKQPSCTSWTHCPTTDVIGIWPHYITKCTFMRNLHVSFDCTHLKRKWTIIIAYSIAVLRRPGAFFQFPRQPDKPRIRSKFAQIKPLSQALVSKYWPLLWAQGKAILIVGRFFIGCGQQYIYRLYPGVNKGLGRVKRGI